MGYNDLCKPTLSFLLREAQHTQSQDPAPVNLSAKPVCATLLPLEQV